MRDRLPPSEAWPPAAEPRNRRRARRAVFWTTAVSASVAVHVGVLMLNPTRAPAPEMDVWPPDAVVVSLAPPPQPIPPPAPEPAPDTAPAEAEAAAAPASEAAPTVVERPAPPPPPRIRQARPTTQVEPLRAAPAPAAPPAPIAMPTLSDAQLAGALRAGSGTGAGGSGGPGAGGTGGAGGGGGSGGSCDMVARLEEALRDDANIVAAVSEADRVAGGGRALLIWNGGWVQNPGQDGRGLAGVRQAIALEVAFAPRHCREQAVRGMAVIQLSEARVALGTGNWTWSDLLEARR